MPNQRWNDQAIDGLEARVDDLENEREATASIPERVADMIGEVREAVATNTSTLQGVATRQDDQQAAISRLHRRLDERLDKVDGDHQTARDELAKRAPLTTREAIKAGAAFATTVIVPIIVALIGAYFVLRAGGHK